ncbi:MAG TPA: lipopolysaccharide assembly protein LapA domain-containing protein [Trebonia sp.]|nr:lipopolysaccharide assembly protein LapA domain-containing protein [Trebonia sp.]
MPGQRPEPTLPPDADRNQIAEAAAESTGPVTPVTPTAANTPVTPAEPGQGDAGHVTPGPGAPTPPDAQAAPPGTATAPAAPPETPAAPTVLPQHHKLRRTRLSGTWVAIFFFALVLVFLLIFILQNSHTVDVSYFGAHGHLPLGVALLLAAVCGILLVSLAGGARIMQLRATARKHRRSDVKAAKAGR